MRALNVPLYVLTTSVMLVSSCASMMITHPDFDQQRQQIKAIGIMPPDLQMFSETENSSERRPELDAEAAKHVVTALTEVLRKAAMKPTAVPISDALLEKDQDLARNLGRQREIFARTSDFIIKQHGKIMLMPFDRSISTFSELGKTDYLVFVRGRGYVFSARPHYKRDAVVAGVTTAVFGKGINVKRERDKLVLEVGIINGRTGDLLWYNTNAESSSKYDPLERSSVKVLCEKILAPLIKKQ